MVDSLEERVIDVEHRTQQARQELVERLTVLLEGHSVCEPHSWLRLRRETSVGNLTHGMTFPALCLIPQGGKDVFLGNRHFHYDPQTCLLTTAELPVVGQVTDASPERPYLGIMVKLDAMLVNSVALENASVSIDHPPSTSALGVHDIDPDLLDAVVRLMRTVDSAHESRRIAPLILQEIVIRLLHGSQRQQLLAMSTRSGSMERVGRAIQRLRRDFDKPLRVDTLAYEIGMSVSSFHQHFKAVTAMSPLQFQKQLRLQEARRLMLADDVDATQAALRVGYGDASHFSREYRRQFGQPPLRDVRRLRSGTRPAEETVF